MLLQPGLGDPLLQSHPALASLKRHSQRLKTVFTVYEEFRLHIDYRLAALRFALAMEPVDDYWYKKKQVLPKAKMASHSDLQDRILRTRRACEKALRHAQYLDRGYECEWRQQEIRGRLERLDEIVTSTI